MAGFTNQYKSGGNARPWLREQRNLIIVILMLLVVAGSVFLEVYNSDELGWAVIFTVSFATILAGFVLAQLDRVSVLSKDMKDLEAQTVLIQDEVVALGQSLLSVDVILDRDPMNDIFGCAKEVLESRRWKKVRIWAPVGLWDASPSKDEWLRTLANRLKAPEAERMVAEVSATFGLPPRTRLEHGQLPIYATQRLEHFRDSEANLRYLPPPPEDGLLTGPALGMIIFEAPESKEFVVLLGVVPDKDLFHVVADGLVIRDLRFGQMMARGWFDKRIFLTVDRRDKVIMGADPSGSVPVPLDEGFQNIRLSYRSQLLACVVSDAGDQIVRYLERVEEAVDSAENVLDRTSGKNELSPKDISEVGGKIHYAESMLNDVREQIDNVQEHEGHGLHQWLNDLSARWEVVERRHRNRGHEG